MSEDFESATISGDFDRAVVQGLVDALQELLEHDKQRFSIALEAPGDGFLHLIYVEPESGEVD